MIVVIDYGMGNLRSVSKALEFLGATVRVSGKARDVDRAAAVVLPGVGHFGAAERNLAASGLREAVVRAIQSGKPFLGICLGLQLLFDGSDEAPRSKGLGILRGRVGELDRGGRRLKLPHMGWNRAQFRNGSGEFFYFVHSYAPVPVDRDVIAAETEYGARFVSAIEWENVLACQFHPEKSQAAGLRFLRERFLRPNGLL
ncbi:MAG: imidazole glycerol phosphate synthase subunit HisH [Nitrospirae bacterium]|nr:imidazole glycerol phosphate synthase subunit HisH [Nitrospirota bacterium]